MTKRRGTRGRPAGRRPGGQDTRGTILAAARASFAARGYDATTMRGVARDAGVDPALVHHYFAGKHDLFVRSLDIPIDPDLLLSRVLDGGVDDLGERLLRTFLQAWEDPDVHARLIGFVRAVTGSEEGAAMMREAFATILYQRIGPYLDVPDPSLRLNAVASQLVGLAMVRYVVRLEPMASAEVDDLVRLVAPNVQRYLTGD